MTTPLQLLVHLGLNTFASLGSNNVHLDLDTSNFSVVQGSNTCPSLLTGGECDECIVGTSVVEFSHLAKLLNGFFEVVIGGFLKAGNRKV